VFSMFIELIQHEQDHDNAMDKYTCSAAYAAITLTTSIWYKVPDM